MITNHQLVFERKTDRERVLVAINASDAEFSAGSHELNGTFERIMTYPEAAAKTDTDNAETDTVTLNGQLSMPPYSIQYLKM